MKSRSGRLHSGCLVRWLCPGGPSVPLSGLVPFPIGRSLRKQGPPFSVLGYFPGGLLSVFPEHPLEGVDDGDGDRRFQQFSQRSKGRRGFRTLDIFAASLVYGRRRTRCSKDSLSVCSLLRAARRKSKFFTTRPRHGTGQKCPRIRLTFGVGVETDNVGVETEYDLRMLLKNASTRDSKVITSS